ncbi:BamA/TamA family outer membrane protein [bacterium]|nr:BamA/TamA family outer membrane protein [bacterium]
MRRIAPEGPPTLGRSQLVHLTGLEEGERVSIDRLHATADTIRRRVSTLTSYPLAELDRIELLYGPRGRFAELLFTIDPGPEMQVDTIAISGPGSSSSDEILARLRTQPGETFQPATWNSDLDIIATTYEENGFPFARVVTRPLVPEFREETIGIRLGMEVTPGVAVTVKRIEFAGNKRTRTEVLNRLAQYPTGERYDRRDVERARRNLQRTGWFATVGEGELFRDHAGGYGLLYRVQEQSTSSVSGALGYAPEENNSGGIAGVIDIHLSNLLGTGRSFDLSWRRDNPRLTSFALGYREPWIAGSPISAEIGLAQDVADSQYVALEGRLSADAQFAQGWTATLGARTRSVSADSLASGPDSLTYSLVGATAALSLDTRDRAENPRTGGIYRASSERLWPWGNSDTSPGQLLRTTLDLEHTVEVSPGWVGFIGVHASEVRALEGGLPPIAEWSRIGGASTMRGFAERSLLAPRAGWMTLEARRLVGPRSRLFVLLDGTVLDNSGTTRTESSYGIGAQIDTGIGLLTVATALPTSEGWSATVVHARVAARF